MKILSRFAAGLIFRNNLCDLCVSAVNNISGFLLALFNDAWI
jgi:hypothetical protein